MFCERIPLAKSDQCSGAYDSLSHCCEKFEMFFKPPHVCWAVVEQHKLEGVLMEEEGAMVKDTVEDPPLWRKESVPVSRI